MPFVTRQGLRWWEDEALAALGVRHGFFTRHGGVSPPPWATLNTGGSVGDAPERVAENLRRAFAALDRDVTSRYDVWQVHGARAVRAEAPRRPTMPPLQADIILTASPRVTLLMRFADCVPVLLYDPRRHALALAHAGWRGTVAGASAAAVRALVQAYGSHPHDLIAVIGPSIGPNDYEVGAEVHAAFVAAFGPEQARAWLRAHRPGHWLLDLWAANAWQLHGAGVGQVRIVGLSTAAHTQDWFSHRAERGRTGRFAVLAAVPDDI